MRSAGNRGVLVDAGFAALAFQFAEGSGRGRARLVRDLMETVRVEPGGRGTGARDGAAGQRGTVGQKPVPYVPCGSKLPFGEPGHAGGRRSRGRVRNKRSNQGAFSAAARADRGSAGSGCGCPYQRTADRLQLRLGGVSSTGACLERCARESSEAANERGLFPDITGEADRRAV